MGLSVQDFAGLTPTQFDAIYEQWQARQDATTRERWEQTRWLMWSMLRPYAKKRGLQPTDVLKLPWDKKRHIPKMTQAEREASLREMEHYNTLWSDGNKDDIRD
jgi:hypothetical protein